MRAVTLPCSTTWFVLVVWSRTSTSLRVGVDEACASNKGPALAMHGMPGFGTYYSCRVPAARALPKSNSTSNCYGEH
eukprot:scaffold219368_cov33-Tisochrysis_lutea.AAC.1